MKQNNLYNPEFEHDACGVGLVIDIHGNKSHDIVEKSLQVLENMLHRGAESADNKTGDGAGIMLQIPHEFILLQGIPVPERGKYGTGLVFLPQDEEQAKLCMDTLKNVLTQEGLDLLAVRDLPVNSDILGEISRANEPLIRQIFVVDQDLSGDHLEQRLYVARKKIEKNILQSALQDKRSFYIVSLSTSRIVYKGMLTSTQLREYFPDLSNPYFTSGLALVHSRFSTNTFPTWDLAQPFRLLGHNGEINTIRGNRYWMEARESLLGDFRMENGKWKVENEKEKDSTSNFQLSTFNFQFSCPIVQSGMSDSASLDNVLEFLMMSGKTLPHALAMLVPESWNDKNPISPELKAFYEYHSIIMEPWDGPATLLFTDGRYAGGMLDRNGLRPARYLITKNDVMVVASEAGVLPFEASEIREKGRLQPGKMLMVDTQEGTIQYDAQLKETLAKAYPYEEWLSKSRIILSDIHSGRTVKHKVENQSQLLRAFGYSKEDMERIILPMTTDSKEPIGSMGNDTPLAVLSEKPQRLFNYFRQLFAQVTNPPIDPIREELVMSLSLYIGTQEGNLLEPSPELCKMVKLQTPVINNQDLDILRHLGYKGFRTLTIPMLFDIDGQAEENMEKAIRTICTQTEQAVNEGYNYVILSDKGINAKQAAIPSLLAVSAVHHHLINKKKRMQIAIVVETAEVREVMHFALLLGFGATAINPYMVFSILEHAVDSHEIQLDYHTAEKNYIKAVNKGLLKILSKMGISTLRSYRGAQIFEAVGISQKLLDNYFRGMVSRIGGIELDDIVKDTLFDHSSAFSGREETDTPLENKGFYAYRKNGEYHAWNPETIKKLQVATHLGDYEKFKEYTRLVDEKAAPVFLRDFFTYKRNPIDISEVEPVESITRHFVTGAMSFGSISKEAHEAIAIALNAIHGRSNTGEGGEDPARYHIGEDGLNRRSAIKQIASGRFGVTAEYLVNADELQIKVAQGAKPGEGGQLPGFKVNDIVAKTRHSIPGITLISPPPHHDIYSIEDLAQLIFDLKNINPTAEISVKLVAESGVGTIAAGVAKAKADRIIISGAEGGTGASPISSVKHAGIPGELGLAETQQTLVMNNLRGFVRLQTDGQLKTGKDIIISALLGAEEFGFSTSALVVLGCVMDRKCHQNTCPVGIATQDEKLRACFKGKHEYVINFMTFLAQEVREQLAQMGFRRIDEIVGRSDLLEIKPMELSDKIRKLDLKKLMYFAGNGNDIRHTKSQEYKIDKVLDHELIRKTQPAIKAALAVEVKQTITNTDRSVGAMLSGEIAKRYGGAGLPENTITVKFNGSAGQSFGAFLSSGITFRLEGESNDYLGKGLSGGKIILVPPANADFVPENNIIAGNTLLYGATSGEVYINGKVGERFCVRNSGAIAVVEGVGDHCCEYMTGGRTVVLGETGKNFAAGMSGGLAYVLDMDGTFDSNCNMEMVELSLIEDQSDNRELFQLLSNHVQHTQSPLAKRILNDWDNYLRRFIKVTPIEYKKVLQEEKMEAINRKIAQVERDY
ncbi:glutamate synthase large subunit [Parabacteroides sp. 52]|uniref:glutamate synthase large subunit n=1 Tax=unclassified Parabacteroides TaxID=2649774 RepID=UPI0013D7BCC1|nr:MULTISPECIES: glutamate synthase large subunit [unclassified Parabacteroides]MDH6533506.1 glutamate synthase (NADPH/NADH) large chain [Parabacteroides sp. PM5-20]NDV54259.1 glutamate synthase large subunit [Parabacteroides sp. 52]